MKCWFCGGKGTMQAVNVDAALNDGKIITYPTECDHCKGSGKIGILKWLQETWVWRIKIPLIIWYDLHFNDDDWEGY